jgi:O-antigen chain-terminating methyltransferase
LIGSKGASPDAIVKGLETERAAADDRYNDALTAVDQALPVLPEFPSPPPAFDEFQITPLNQLWSIVGSDPPSASGWRGRVTAFIWRTIGPMLQRQQQFNAAMVDHVNRNVTLQRETVKAIDSTIAVLRDQLSALVAFHQHLILYLQQITPYVDTRDREVAGRLIGLSAAIGGVGDELRKRWESMVAREQRYDARVRSLEQLRESVALVQQATHAIRRQLEASPVITGAAGAAPSPAPPAGNTLDSYRYVGFEDQFRGSKEDIRARVADYLPLFAGASDVVDIGCGRGEFLDLLRARGVKARGLDINHEMVEVCRERGLDAEQGDALAYLQTLPDGSIGGLFAAQVVEHLEPAYLTQLIDVAFAKLRPGSRIVLETINPACWAAFFESYIRDISHVRPLHPDTLKYLLVASGFQRVEIRFRAPFPEHAKLQTLAAAQEHGGSFADGAIDTFNENMSKLNGLMFSYFDYAAIGERL